MCDTEHKRSEMLNGNRVSQIGHSFHILSEGSLFCYGKILSAFRLVLLRAPTMGPMPYRSISDLAMSCQSMVYTRLRSREAIYEDLTGAVHVSTVVVAMRKEKEREHDVPASHWRWERARP